MSGSHNIQVSQNLYDALDRTRQSLITEGKQLASQLEGHDTLPSAARAEYQQVVKKIQEVTGLLADLMTDKFVDKKGDVRGMLWSLTEHARDDFLSHLGNHSLSRLIEDHKEEIERRIRQKPPGRTR